MGDLGRAILNYRRAQLLLPGDPDLLSNLEYARSRRADKIPEPEPRLLLKTLFFWHYDVPLAWKRGLFLVLGPLLVVRLGVPFHAAPLRPVDHGVTGVVAALWLGSLLVDQVAL